MFFLFVGNNVLAKTPIKKFMFSVSQYYSPVTDACTMGIGIGYLFPKISEFFNFVYL